jgi:hypothetical protein
LYGEYDDSAVLRSNSSSVIYGRDSADLLA